MRFFRRIAGILGFAKDDSHDLKNEDEDVDSDNQPSNRVHMQETGLPRRGFSVPVQVAVNRPQPGPILVPSSSGDGGVQVPSSSRFSEFYHLFFILYDCWIVCVSRWFMNEFRYFL